MSFLPKKDNLWDLLHQQVVYQKVVYPKQQPALLIIRQIQLLSNSIFPKFGPSTKYPIYAPCPKDLPIGILLTGSDGRIVSLTVDLQTAQSHVASSIESDMWWCFLASSRCLLWEMSSIYMYIYIYSMIYVCKHMYIHVYTYLHVWSEKCASLCILDMYCTYILLYIYCNSMIYAQKWQFDWWMPFFFELFFNAETWKFQCPFRWETAGVHGSEVFGK